MNRKVPVIISKQSGVAEVVQHALKVDFWDVDQMANMILAVLQHAPLREALRINGYHESYKFKWEDSAAKIMKVYEEVAGQAQVRVN